MNVQTLKEYALDVIPEEQKEVFSKLYDGNIIDRQRLLKGCINHFYDAKFKENDNDTASTVIDTSIEFEVSISTIQNVIHKFRNVRLDF